MYIIFTIALQEIIVPSPPSSTLVQCALYTKYCYHPTTILFCKLFSQHFWYNGTIFFTVSVVPNQICRKRLESLGLLATLSLPLRTRRAYPPRPHPYQSDDTITIHNDTLLRMLEPTVPRRPAPPHPAPSERGRRGSRQVIVR